MHDRSRSESGKHVAIVGGGLAGIAAASALSKHHFTVALFEARDQLGGRAGSYVDQTSNEVIDNCQHVSMGCCTNLTQLCRDLGISTSFETQPQLNFVAPSGEIIPFRESWLPPPFHLSRSFLRLSYLSLREKRLFALATRVLATSSASKLQGVNFADWLKAQHQTERLIRCVWEVVLVSALSESLDRIDAAYAQKVFVDGFLANRTGWRVQVPSETLTELYSEKTAAKLASSGVSIHCRHRLSQLAVADEHVSGLTFSDQQLVVADDYIVAVPHQQIARLFPPDVAQHASISKLSSIESAPITSVHLWLDRPITQLPHAVFVDRISQWLFTRPATVNSDGTPVYRYQIVISASRNLSGQSQTQIVAMVLKELSEIWEDAAAATLLHDRVITEKRAVFSATPGIDELRPAQQSFLNNLQFAGDWTQTGWPATMEGAVRSGYLAANNILRKHGIEANCLAADLPQSWLSRVLLGRRYCDAST